MQQFIQKSAKGNRTVKTFNKNAKAQIFETFHSRKLQNSQSPILSQQVPSDNQQNIRRIRLKATSMKCLNFNRKLCPVYFSTHQADSLGFRKRIHQKKIQILKKQAHKCKYNESNIKLALLDDKEKKEKEWKHWKSSSCLFNSCVKSQSYRNHRKLPGSSASTARKQKKQLIKISNKQKARYHDLVLAIHDKSAKMKALKLNNTLQLQLYDFVIQKLQKISESIDAHKQMQGELLCDNKMKKSDLQTEPEEFRYDQYGILY